MDTRNLTAVKLDGEYRIAQYCQWDGYPAGQGDTVLDFLRTWDRPRFEANLRQCSWISKEEMQQLWVDCGSDGDSATFEVSDRFKEKHPELHRDTGARVLALVQEKPLKLDNQIGFAADSLFCEWAYVIDLDENVLEVYKGFNKGPLDTTARFGHLPAETHGGTVYHPIAMAVRYPLDDLPTVEEMSEDCEPDDPDDQGDEDEIEETPEERADRLRDAIHSDDDVVEAVQELSTRWWKIVTIWTNPDPALDSYGRLSLTNQEIGKLQKDFGLDAIDGE